MLAGASVAAGLSNSDFYVAAATVIPVIFLGLVLQGGLWEWIARQIETGRRPAALSESFVSALQMFALVILFGGTVGEILALYVLWQQHAGSWVGYVVFFSAAFLVALLGVTLAAKVPGILFYKASEPALRLEFRESILWSGNCVWTTPGEFPPSRRSGKLFLTDGRLVWMEYKLPTSSKPYLLEIRWEQIVSTKESTRSIVKGVISCFLTIVLDPTAIFNLILRESRIDIATDAGKSYRFILGTTVGHNVTEYLRACLALIPTAP